MPFDIAPRPAAASSCSTADNRLAVGARPALPRRRRPRGAAAEPPPGRSFRPPAAARRRPRRRRVLAVERRRRDSVRRPDRDRGRCRTAASSCSTARAAGRSLVSPVRRRRARSAAVAARSQDCRCRPDCGRRRTTSSLDRSGTAAYAVSRRRRTATRRSRSGLTDSGRRPGARAVAAATSRCGCSAARASVAAAGQAWLRLRRRLDSRSSRSRGLALRRAGALVTPRPRRRRAGVRLAPADARRVPPARHVARGLELAADDENGARARRSGSPSPRPSRAAPGSELPFVAARARTRTPRAAVPAREGPLPAGQARADRRRPRLAARARAARLVPALLVPRATTCRGVYREDGLGVVPRPLPRQHRGVLHRDRGSDRGGAGAVRPADRAGGGARLARRLVRRRARPAVGRERGAGCSSRNASTFFAGAGDDARRRDRAPARARPLRRRDRVRRQRGPPALATARIVESYRTRQDARAWCSATRPSASRCGSSPAPTVGARTRAATRSTPAALAFLESQDLREPRTYPIADPGGETSAAWQRVLARRARLRPDRRPTRRRWQRLPVPPLREHRRGRRRVRADGSAPDDFSGVRPAAHACRGRARRCVDWFQFQSVVLPMRGKAHRFTVLLPVAAARARHAGTRARPRPAPRSRARASSTCRSRRTRSSTSSSSGRRSASARRGSATTPCSRAAAACRSSSSPPCSAATTSARATLAGPGRDRRDPPYPARTHLPLSLGHRGGGAMTSFAAVRAAPGRAARPHQARQLLAREWCSASTTSRRSSPTTPATTTRIVRDLIGYGVVSGLRVTVRRRRRARAARAGRARRGRDAVGQLVCVVAGAVRLPQRLARRRTWPQVESSARRRRRTRPLCRRRLLPRVPDRRRADPGRAVPQRRRADGALAAEGRASRSSCAWTLRPSSRSDAVRDFVALGAEHPRRRRGRRRASTPSSSRSARPCGLEARPPPSPPDLLDFLLALAADRPRRSRAIDCGRSTCARALPLLGRGAAAAAPLAAAGAECGCGGGRGARCRRRLHARSPSSTVPLADDELTGASSSPTAPDRGHRRRHRRGPTLLHLRLLQEWLCSAPRRPRRWPPSGRVNADGTHGRRAHGARLDPRQARSNDDAVPARLPRLRRQREHVVTRAAGQHDLRREGAEHVRGDPERRRRTSRPTSAPARRGRRRRGCRRDWQAGRRRLHGPDRAARSRVVSDADDSTSRSYSTHGAPLGQLLQRAAADRRRPAARAGDPASAAGAARPDRGQPASRYGLRGRGDARHLDATAPRGYRRRRARA